MSKVKHPTQAQLKSIAASLRMRRRQHSSMTQEKRIRASKPKKNNSLRKSQPSQSQIGWRLRSLESEVEKTRYVEITFPLREGGYRKHMIPLADLGVPGHVSRQLRGLGAQLPANVSEANAKLNELIQAMPDRPAILTAKPGFRDRARTFVLPTRILGRGTSRYVWDKDADDGDWYRSTGSLDRYVCEVLGIAEHSPYITLAVLVALAAVLPEYVRQRQRHKAELLTETGVFHFFGDTSTGKTTLAKVALSVGGHPGAISDWEATKRGFVERAYHRNCMVLALDDTENALEQGRDLLRLLTTYAARITSGQSKDISVGARRGGIHKLSWSCLGISTGTHSVVQLAAEHNYDRQGNFVRFIEISIPNAVRGGIFGYGAMEGPAQQERRTVLMRMLEAGIARNHGVLLKAWVGKLIRTNVCERIRALKDHFVNLVAEGHDGKIRRLAAKFGVLYAAGVIAGEWELVPWRETWIREALSLCFANAWSSASAQLPEVTAGISHLACELENKRRFIQVQSKDRPDFGQDAVGLRVKADKSWTYWLANDALETLQVTPEARQQIWSILKSRGVLVSSNNRSSSVQKRVTQRGKVVKMRFWRLNISKLREVAAALG